MVVAVVVAVEHLHHAAGGESEWLLLFFYFLYINILEYLPSMQTILTMNGLSPFSKVYTVIK